MNKHVLHNIITMDALALPIFPSCPNCLAWSDDGELAIAAGEFVQVLVCISLLPMFPPLTVTDSERY